MDVVCKKCGSEYSLGAQKIPVRDKDTLECEVCGETIFSWNEAKIWHATLVVRKENHLKKS